MAVSNEMKACVVNYANAVGEYALADTPMIDALEMVQRQAKEQLMASIETRERMVIELARLLEMLTAIAQPPEYVLDRVRNLRAVIEEMMK